MFQADRVAAFARTVLAGGDVAADLLATREHPRLDAAQDAIVRDTIAKPATSG